MKKKEEKLRVGTSYLAYKVVFKEGVVNSWGKRTIRSYIITTSGLGREERPPDKQRRRKKKKSPLSKVAKQGDRLLPPKGR